MRKLRCVSPKRGLAGRLLGRRTDGGEIAERDRSCPGIGGANPLHGQRLVACIARMTMTIERILLLSDVTLGFAVPQVTMLARSLAEWLGAETLIVEPDMKGRRDMAEIPGVQIRRIATRMPPHSRVFALEYVRALRPIYRDFNADLLIVLN